ncbi:MAG TPA: DUF4129 domain-containing protein [Asanoa sp.]
MDLASLRRWWPFAAIAVLLGLAAVAAGHSALKVSPVTQQQPTVPGGQEDFASPINTAFPTETPNQVAEAHPTDLPGWIGPLAAGLCVAVVLVVVGIVLYRLLRDVILPNRHRTIEYDAEPVPPPVRAAEEVVAALDAGLIDLSDADSDPRRAVIACWLRLEQAAAAAGTPKRIGDSPTDLVGRLLGAHEVSADVLAALADVYREARYATHAVDDRMRAQARSALQRIRAELTAGAPR